MKNLSGILLLCVSLTFISCNNDDDGSQGTGNSTTSNTINFDGVSSTEFRLWVGGSELNTTGIDVADLLSEEDLSFIDLDQMAMTSFFFKEDTIEVTTITGDLIKTQYHFSNDSLFIGSAPFNEMFVGMGSTYVLSMERGLMYYSKATGTAPDPVNTISGTDAGMLHFTFENTYNSHFFENPAAMNENDTVLIYNQILIYN